MILTGDIALGELPPPVIEGLPDRLRRVDWLGNLEGPVSRTVPDQNAVYSSERSYNRLVTALPFKALSLANNHIDDLTPRDVTYTQRIVEGSRIVPFGIGTTQHTAYHRAYLPAGPSESNTVVLNYAWSVIGCTPATRQRAGCTDVDPDRMISEVTAERAARPDHGIVVYLHWGIELEVAPQPFHRALAHRLVDAGADLIVGCHAHRYQGAEIYRGKTIAFGIGNWMFARQHFWGGRLDYPAGCNAQYLVEYDPENRTAQLHQVDYVSNETLRYVGPVHPDEANAQHGIRPFTDMTQGEYDAYFPTVRTKTKLLPIYRADDPAAIRKMKDNWITLRHRLIMALLWVRKRMAS